MAKAILLKCLFGHFYGKPVPVILTCPPLIDNEVELTPTMFMLTVNVMGLLYPMGSILALTS